MDDEKTIVRVGNRSTAVPYGGGPFGSYCGDAKISDIVM